MVTLAHATAPRPSPRALLALPFAPYPFRHLCAGQSPPATYVAVRIFTLRAAAAWRTAAASVLVTAAVHFLCVSVLFIS